MYLIKEYDIIPLNKDENIMINYISGASDVINKKICKYLVDEEFHKIPENILKLLFQRKYIFSDEEAKNNFEINLSKKIDLLEKKQTPNFLIIPTYSCNLNCIYCYEQEYCVSKIHSSFNKNKDIDKLFNSIEKIVGIFKERYNENLENKEIIITLMGGEPLLYENKDKIAYIINQINRRDYSYNVITNGYELDDFLDLLAFTNVESIQVTIDGPRNIHDLRRVNKNENGSYEKIMKNLRKSIEKNVKTYLRVNIDETNIEHLPKLAHEIIKNIGLSNNLVPYLYLLQDGGCSGDKNIVDEVKCIKLLMDIERRYPIIKIFKKMFHAQSTIDSIVNNKEVEFKIRNCAACKNQYIFDYKGDIYKCWFGVGNKNFRIGEYLNTLDIEEKLNERWMNRSILTLKKCRKCKYKFICGGGCVSHIIKSGDQLNIEKCDNYKGIFEELLIYELNS